MFLKINEYANNFRDKKVIWDFQKKCCQGMNKKSDIQKFGVKTWPAWD